MGKIAFVFSGQGDQYSGMGKELAMKYTCAAQVFEKCDKIRPGTSMQCFEGTQEELKETVNTQPCLFAVEMAMVEVLNELGVHPDALAGFSLGEVVACCVSGAIDFEDAFRLVCRRGELMQNASQKYDTSMAAVIKLPQETVETICKKYKEVYPVNFNCPGQISVAGASDKMADFAAEVKAVGGRAIPLKVKGAFHSPFMQEASEAFVTELRKVEFRKPLVTLYSNVTAEPYSEDLRGLLAKQISSPVLWETIIRNMIASGIDTFIEIGPGKTLTNMIGKIDSEVKCYTAAELQTLCSEVASC